MDKQNKTILNNILKVFEEIGYSKDEIVENIKEKRRKKKFYQVQKISNLKEMINNSGKEFKDEIAFKFKDKTSGDIKTITYGTYCEEINALGTELIDMGLKNKKIAVISENRYEWALSYMAVVCGVGVIVPLDKSLPANELESLIVRSGVEAIFYSSKYDEVMNDIKQRRTTNLRYFISMDKNTWEEGIYSQKELIERGVKLHY